MKIKKLYIGFLLLIMVGNSAFAQTKFFYGIFPTIDHSGKLSQKWSYYTYDFAAYKPYAGELFGLYDEERITSAYFEAGFTYRLLNKLTASASYVFERQNPFKDYYRNENRIFQQITIKPSIKNKLDLKFRVRFDERFIQNRITKKAPFTHRLRLLAGFGKDLNPKYYLFAYSEYFFNTSGNFTFNENWSALQIGRKLNKNNKVEAGLLYIAWINDSKGNWLNQYFLQMTWVSQIDLTKKDKQ